MTHFLVVLETTPRPFARAGWLDFFFFDLHALSFLWSILVEFPSPASLQRLGFFDEGFLSGWGLFEGLRNSATDPVIVVTSSIVFETRKSKTPFWTFRQEWPLDRNSLANRQALYMVSPDTILFPEQSVDIEMRAGLLPITSLEFITYGGTQLIEWIAKSIISSSITGSLGMELVNYYVHSDKDINCCFQTLL